MDFNKHIKENIAQFNNIEQVPADAIWVGIQHTLQRRTRRKRIISFTIAASILFIFITPFLFNFKNYSSFSESPLSTQERKYYQLAAHKKDALGFNTLDPKIYGEIFNELNILDSMYMELKIELANSPDTGQAIETAIRFHERRLRILELLEKEIENQKRFEQHEDHIKI